MINQLQVRRGTPFNVVIFRSSVRSLSWILYQTLILSI